MTTPILAFDIETVPDVLNPKVFDQLLPVTDEEGKQMARRLAREEGIFCGISSGGACAIALRVAQSVENATIVFVVCDRGDRYLSTGVFPA